MDKTVEQEAREMLERMGIESAQSFSAGEIVELADLIAAYREAVAALHSAYEEFDVYWVSKEKFAQCEQVFATAKRLGY